MKNRAVGSIALEVGNSEGLSIYDENDVDHGVFWDNIDSDDINDSIVVYLADGPPSVPGATVQDTITLIDVTDGDDPTTGHITVDPTRAYTEIPNGGG